MPSAFGVMLESKVAFLRQASSFPDPAYRVEAIETHMSWVFLTEAYAYKLKKPVCHELLDFSTVEARHHYCKEEVRLNRRLAAQVYIGIVALSIDANGHLHLGEDGTIIDWLVKMHRLPAQHMLDYAIKNRTASTHDIRRVASKLAAFYCNSLPINIEAEAYRTPFLSDINRNRETLSRPAYQLAAEQICKLCDDQCRFFLAHSDKFDERVKNKKIFEGHGDLRPEHICLEPTIAVIDCLEFSRALRITDAVDELGFLALECERLGMPDLGHVLLDVYSKLSGDTYHPLLLHFYQSYRATLRARIAIKHLDEAKFRYSSEWRSRATHYLKLAQQHQDAINSVIESPA
jgi:aminoglycoside phosphotransferase family enzyme